MRLRERVVKVWRGVRQNWLRIVIIAASVLAFGIVICLPILTWGKESVYTWLKGDDSGGAVIRNAGLLIGGIIAIALAVWRSRVAERQADTAQQSLLNERYQQGSEMLGSDVLAVRLGGIYALARLATDHPDLYHIQIMEVLCAFVRNPRELERIEREVRNSAGDVVHFEEHGEDRSDVETIVRAIGSRGLMGIAIERGRNFSLYLRSANLTGLRVQDANLSRAWLAKADLSGSILPRADLSLARLRQAKLDRAELRRADLSNSNLWGASLSKTILRSANLSGADFCGVNARSSRYRKPARGLTQAQLDRACADPNNPPHLDGVLDAETGRQLVWRGKPCGE